jgi:putative addiction module CopG family antidote
VELSLTPELDAFVRRLVDSGAYASGSDVVEAALQLLEREQIDWLAMQMDEARAEVDRGEVIRESGTFWEDLRREIAARRSA